MGVRKIAGARGKLAAKVNVRSVVEGYYGIVIQPTREMTARAALLVVDDYQTAINDKSMDIP
jgi:hypothetical protein